MLHAVTCSACWQVPLKEGVVLFQEAQAHTTAFNYHYAGIQQGPV